MEREGKESLSKRGFNKERNLKLLRSNLQWKSGTLTRGEFPMMCEGGDKWHGNEHGGKEGSSYVQSRGVVLVGLREESPPGGRGKRCLIRKKGVRRSGHKKQRNIDKRRGKGGGSLLVILLRGSVIVRERGRVSEFTKGLGGLKGVGGGGTWIQSAAKEGRYTWLVLVKKIRVNLLTQSVDILERILGNVFFEERRRAISVDAGEKEGKREEYCRTLRWEKGCGYL